MKKYLYHMGIILLLLFSFYYTKEVNDYLKEQDPIMKEIKKYKEKYTQKGKNAIIKNNTIKSGKYGKEIDYKKTYQNMKNYGTYNEVLTELKDTKPTISIEDYYDKYVIGGNEENKNIALVFNSTNDEETISIIKLLEEENKVGTFFIDGTFLEENTLILKTYKNQEYEIKSYQNSYEEDFLKTSISYLETLTGKKAKFCYTEEENEILLNICKKQKLHTIIPNIIEKKNILKNIKKNLENSSIISLETNNYVRKELKTLIDYIERKGFKIVTLEELIEEKNN